jgi:hypothetical protein
MACSFGVRFKHQEFYPAAVGREINASESGGGVVFCGFEKSARSGDHGFGWNGRLCEQRCARGEAEDEQGKSFHLAKGSQDLLSRRRVPCIAGGNRQIEKSARGTA